MTNDVMDVLDDLDRLILAAIQDGFPLERRPYAALAARLSADEGLAELTEDKVLERVAALRRRGVIRRLGAIFDGRRLGYQSTLCAARVPAAQIERFAELVNAEAGVTHNYLRSDDLNVWFTFSSPEPEKIHAFIERLKRESGLDEIHSLPSEKVFKIKVEFPMTSYSVGR